MGGAFADGSVARRLASGIGALALLAAAAAPAGSSAETPVPHAAPAASLEIDVSGSQGSTGWAPATLRTAFTSRALEGPATPPLSRISIELTNAVALDGTGLPPCPLADLLEDYGEEERPCPGSLVGHGTVVAEVTPPGQNPVVEQGRMLAYYGFAEGRPRILARVSGDTFTYVIPFRLEQVQGVYGTRLVVPKMSRIRGRCPSGHPNCFGQPYALQGAYSRISDFQMSLHRTFARDGGRASFVGTRCAAGTRSNPRRPLEKLLLAYTDGTYAETMLGGRCGEAVAGRRG